MKEEISEVVAFLQNPMAFQEIGARAPRVCCNTKIFQYDQALLCFHFNILLLNL